MTHPSLPLKSEVIVIGSGFAGLSAAIECRMRGGNVIVLEKMKALGGNSIISDGGIAAPNTPEQASLGIHDSVDWMFEDMQKSAEGLNDPNITRRVCEHASEAYQWSKDVLGVKYLPRADIFGGHRVARCYTPDPLSGSTMILKMRDKCKELGIPILCGVAVVSFVLDDQKAVIGVVLDTNFSLGPNHPKQLQNVYATKGIIIASGGFAADDSFRLKHNPNANVHVQTTNKITTRAEVLEACIQIHCKTANLDLVQWMPWTTNDETGYGQGGLFGDYIVSSYGILIQTKTGRRFVNELANRKLITEKILESKDVIGIADAYALANADWDLRHALQKGVIQAHRTWQDLAEYYQVPLADLVETIETYNLSIETKIDPFQKKIEPWMKALQVPPYYSMRIHPKTHYALGGLVTNTEAQVLDENGHIMKGLFAVGEVTGLTHGANRLGSCSITECLVMGRIAGKNVLDTSNSMHAGLQ